MIRWIYVAVASGFRFSEAGKVVVGKQEFAEFWLSTSFLKKIYR
jgi:hypothetical protein